MVDTIYSASSRNSLKFSPTFGTIHHVLLHQLDFYSDHATLFPAQVCEGGWGTWEFHISLFLYIVYICACIFFWLISFYLWLVLIFLFSRVYYGFTPLWNRTSWHYMSRQLSCLYARLHTWQPFIGMLIMPSRVNVCSLVTIRY
jgi:hypothetical protein